MISDELNVNFEKIKPFGLKANRIKNIVTHNPSTAGPGDLLRVYIPKLSENIVIVPGSCHLLFDLEIEGHVNNIFVNNLNRSLIKNLKVSYGGEVIQQFQHYNHFKVFEDLFIEAKKREWGLLKYGISDYNTRQLRADAGNKSSTPIIVATIHGNHYIIFLDHPVLNDHGCFYPFELKNSLMFEIKISDVDDIIVYADKSKAPNFKLKNIKLEYSSINSQILASKVSENYKIGKTFLYENITLEKTFTISKPDDELINLFINLPRKSISGILLLFREDVAGSINSEKFVNPNIISIEATINSIPNQLHSNGILYADFWESIKNKFNGNLSQKDYYGANRFCIWLELRCSKSNLIHGGGFKLENSLGGISLVLKRSVGGSGNILCFLYVVSDAVVDIMNNDLYQISY